MFILIEKDSSTSVPKECTYEQAADYANNFNVFVVEDGVNIPFAEYVVKEEVAEVKPSKKSAKVEVTEEAPEESK